MVLSTYYFIIIIIKGTISTSAIVLFFSLKSRKSRILQFLDQKVSNWHWLIFTSFGSLEYNLNFLKELCESALFLLCGFDESQFNKNMLETLTHHTLWQELRIRNYTLVMFKKTTQEDPHFISVKY